MKKLAMMTVAVGALVFIVHGRMTGPESLLAAPRTPMDAAAPAGSDARTQPAPDAGGAATAQAAQGDALAADAATGTPPADTGTMTTATDASAPASAPTPAPAAPAAPAATVPASNLAQAAGNPPASADSANPDTPDTKTPPPANTAASGSATPTVDESALRYFARQGDTRRLNAEIARLKALYPGWKPPVDPLAIPAAGDPRLDALWRLYADGKYAELHKAIETRKQQEKGWEPPHDLVTMLAVAEARDRLVNASNLKQYDTVVRLAAETPSLLTCSEIDMLWRVGEAFAKTGRPQRAEDAYRYVLTECKDQAARLATLQKALALLPRERVENLLALEKGKPDSEFGSIRDELARRSVSRGGTDAAYVAPAGDITRLEALAETTSLPADALLLGWYDYRRSKFDDAERWFRKARSEKDSASASQGLALVLIRARKPAEAEAVMVPWISASKDARAVYLDAVANLLSQQPLPTIGEDVLRRMAPVVIDAHDAAAAQQFGWYARALNQFASAEAWFRTALSYKPDDEPSAYGLALTLFSRAKTAELEALKRQWASRSPRIADVGTARARRASAATRAGVQAEAVDAAAADTAAAAEAPVSARPVAARRTMMVARETGGVTRPRRSSGAQPRGCATHMDPSGLAPQAALDRGWCLMNLNRPSEAAVSFGVALSGPSGKIRQDAAYGQSLAYLRLGLTSKAAIAATQAPQSAARSNELQAAILADRATALFDRGRYTETLITLDQRARVSPERNDLMVLRGYAYFKMHRLLDARRIFAVVAATGNRDAIHGLADVEAALRNE